MVVASFVGLLSFSIGGRIVVFCTQMLPTLAAEAPELHDSGFASPAGQGPLTTLFRAGAWFTLLPRTIQYRDNALSLFLRCSVLGPSRFAL
jgi:hypothetical protein